MPSFYSLSVLASLVAGSAHFTSARPLPQTLTMFTRGFLDAKNDTLTVPNQAAPSDWDTDALEPYNHYYFRFEAISCPDASTDSEFYKTCCLPRKVNEQDDSLYPEACNLPAYFVYDPIYYSDRVVAKLGDGEEAKGTEDVEVSSSSLSSSFSSSTPVASSTDSDSAPPKGTRSSTTTPYVPTSSSKSLTVSSSTWTPSSSSSAMPKESSTYSAPSTSWSSTPEPSTSSSSTHYQVKAAFVPSSSTKESETSSSWTPSSSSSWTSQAAWTPTTSVAAVSTTSQASSSSSSSDYTGGQATYFYQGGVAGACGVVHGDYDLIVALDSNMYGNMGAQSQYCGKSVTITNTNTGATVTATVADACPGCSSYTSLDCSLGTFQQLGSLDLGVIPISWHFD